MSTIHFWVLFVLVICDGIHGDENAEEANDDGFVKSLDFSEVYKTPGLSSLASSPISSAVLSVDKSQYPQLFDTIVSSSIDSLQTQIAPKKSIFSAESFGFNPIASQSFFPTYRSAQLVAKPQQAGKPAAIKQKPLQYDIRTIHDPNYKIYKPEEPTQGEDILAALKQNPSVAAYFKPPTTHVEISHPLDYTKEELIEKLPDKNYKINAYLPGTSRIRRYTDGRRRRHNGKKRRDHDDDDHYGYKSDYTSRPKEFDSDVYSSAYKEEKDPNKDYEYPYAYDSGYDHKEYDRIKDLSEKQAAEIKQNPGNCQEVKKDGMTCQVCKDPKTKGNYESCSYVTEPKNNKYAYSKERKFDSNDEPDEPSKSHDESESSRAPAKYIDSSDEQQDKSESLRSSPESDGPDSYKGYYVHSSKPKVSAELRSSSDEKDSSEEKDSNKQYDYQKALPGFYSNNEQKKDVEHVLAEFKKKDRSSCKKVQKNGMTCYQCIDKSGLKHEECMFVSESAPKRSHLAYQELKEFTSKPPTLEGVADTAESKIVVTSATPIQRSAAIVAAPNAYGRKLKRKKVSKDNITPAAASTVAKTALPDLTAPTVQRPIRSRITKRSENSEVAETTSDKSSLAPPEEFAGASKAAFWAETMPRYSRTLGVTLPEFMLSRSEHEMSFDEAVAGV